MTRLHTLAHVLVALLAIACSSSHGGGDASPDGSLPDGTPDLSIDTGCPEDAGTTPVCARGPCCNDTAAPIMGECGLQCPADYAANCAPDPAAFCDDFFACSLPADCTLASREIECCPACIRTNSNTLAVRADRVDAYRTTLETPDCDGIACAPCAPPSDYDPQIEATCQEERCVAVPLRPTAFTECAEDTDCRVRARSCCECGADTSLGNLIGVGVGGEAAIASIYCGSDPIACPECAPDYSGYEAYCLDDGHCAVREVADDV